MKGNRAQAWGCTCPSGQHGVPPPLRGSPSPQRGPPGRGCQRPEAKGKRFPKWPLADPGQASVRRLLGGGPGHTRVRAAVLRKGPALPVPAVGTSARPAVSGLVPYLPGPRWREQRSENKDGSGSLPAPPPPPHTQAPGSTRQPDRDGWLGLVGWGPGARPALPLPTWLPGALQ